MPYGSFISMVPPAGFLAIHLVAFLIGLYFAYRSFESGKKPLGWGFTLYALAEVMYMTYHLDITTFLFAHTISEVLDLVGFGLVFYSVAGSLTGSQRASMR
jgi:hypothetical protein